MTIRRCDHAAATAIVGGIMRPCGVGLRERAATLANAAGCEGALKPFTPAGPPALCGRPATAGAVVTGLPLVSS